MVGHDGQTPPRVKIHDHLKKIYILHVKIDIISTYNKHTFANLNEIFESNSNRFFFN